MEIELTPDGTVRLRVDGEYTKEEFTDLLYRLIEARAGIAEDPLAPQGLKVPTTVAPGWHTQPAGAGHGDDTFLAFRHPGLGWLGFLIPAVQRVRLAGALMAQQAESMDGGAASPKVDDLPPVPPASRKRMH